MRNSFIGGPTSAGISPQHPLKTQLKTQASITIKGSPVNITVGSPNANIVNSANDPSQQIVNLARFGGAQQNSDAHKATKDQQIINANNQNNKVSSPTIFNKAGKIADPQQMRAKTLNIPKDFREELRKLQVMKQKIGQNNNNNKVSGDGDVVTVTTLGQQRDDSGGWPQQKKEEIKEAILYKEVIKEAILLQDATENQNQQ